MSLFRDRIRLAYHPERFLVDSQIITSALTRYLQDAQGGQSPLRWRDPEVLTKHVQKLTDGELRDDFERLVSEFLQGTHRLHSPRYMGHQVAVPIPLAGLFETLGAVTNQGGAIYEMSPMSTAIERAMVMKLGEYIGWGQGEFGGFATHGGSLANLTALITARNHRYPKFWEDGAPPERKPAIIVSGDSHYSIARAAGILGLGTHHVIKAPLDRERRLRGEAAEQAVKDARAAGLDPFAIIAASGSTATGAFDALDELAEVAEVNDLWLHVDGCHGASALISKQHQALLKGVEQADSLAWDAHKMLFVPALSTYLFYRRRTDSFETFSQDAPYLFDPEAPGLSAYDGAVRTFECTKRSLSIGLWAAWAYYGKELFEDLIDVTFNLGQTFYRMLSESDDFQPVHRPQCNIVCFRHLPASLKDQSPEKISAFQQALRRRLVESGEFYITSTRLDGQMVLRVTLIHPLTEESHLRALLEKLRELGRKI